MARDFSWETRLAREALLRASQLTYSLVKSAGFEPAGFTGSAGVLSELSGKSAPGPNAEADRTLTRLGEALSDLKIMSEVLLDAPAVSLQAFMMLGKSVERELDRAPAAQELRRAIASSVAANLQAPLLALTERVRPDSLGADLRHVLVMMAQLLACLRLVESDLNRDQPLKWTLPIFTLINEDARSLLGFIESRVLRTEGVSQSVLERFDSTSYAIGMELRKVFRHELVGLATLRHAPSIYGKVERAHGLLRNCFQQSTVSLAQAFDPALDGTRLFEGFQTRLDQSRKLCHDLDALLQNVRRAETDRDRKSIAPLVDQLNAFREGSMRFLMYRDWEAYERFIEEIMAARGAVALDHVLHRLSTYLETLLGQVKMRAALAADTTNT